MHNTVCDNENSFGDINEVIVIKYVVRNFVIESVIGRMILYYEK